MSFMHSHLAGFHLDDSLSKKNISCELLWVRSDVMFAVQWGMSDILAHKSPPRCTSAQNGRVHDIEILKEPDAFLNCHSYSVLQVFSLLMRNAFCCSCSQIKPWPTPSDFVATCSFYHGYAFKPKQAGAFMAASFHPSGCTETENLRPTGLPLAAGETGPCPCCWHNEHSSVERAPAKLATGRGPWGWKTHPSGLHRLLNRPGQHGSIWPAIGQTWVPTTIHPK